jgi:predicted transcriptional regulator
MEKITRNEQSTALEKHYSIIEIAELWGISDTTVRKIFTDEPGVLAWGTEERVGRHKKRGYRSIRVPESIMVRVHQRLRA